MEQHALEVKSGNRFEFGKNWAGFLSVLDENRIKRAEASLREYLGTGALNGLTFLDIGSGSGLFSLAARRLGATVLSFDFDPQSVACTRELKRRYFPTDEGWIVQQGSVLDDAYLRDLGDFDIVYSWGVLHHTGAMWKALENAASKVKTGGRLFIAIYNHQIYWTTFSTKMKKAYNAAPLAGKWMISAIFIAFQAVRGAAKDLIFLRNPLKRYRDRKATRGMSMWYDWIDWVGGYPFEVAKPEEMLDYYLKRGFEIRKLKTVAAGHGCNEYVFEKNRVSG